VKEEQEDKEEEEDKEKQKKKRGKVLRQWETVLPEDQLVLHDTQGLDFCAKPGERER
jgi:hypothetical protein